MTNRISSPDASRQRIRKLTVTALLTAILWMMTFTPYFGFTLPFFGHSMTFNHLPMIIAVVMEGLGVGSIMSTMFGLSSWVNSLIRPTSPYSLMFQNPLVSVLPRVLVGPALYGILKLMEKLLPGKRKIHVIVVAICGAALNTLFVLSALTIAQIVNPGMAGLDSGITIVSIWMLAANSPIEMASAVVVTLAITAALDPIYHKFSKE